MTRPDAADLITAALTLAVAAVAGLFLPRLFRLARRFPATRRPAYAWAALVVVLLFTTAVRLAHPPLWVPLAMQAVGLVVCVALLWPLRHRMLAALRGIVPADGPDAQAPVPPRPDLPAASSNLLPEDPGPVPGLTFPSSTGQPVDGVDTARRLFGADPTGSAAGSWPLNEQR